jgi:hypothetical protein
MATQKADDPVDFVTDPDGTMYGSGVVERGGTQPYGPPGSVANAELIAPPQPLPREAITPASELSRPARLDEVDACHGWFPAAATDDFAVVKLAVTVRPSGVVSSASILSENPQGQGFGAAARGCMTSRHFAPALDRGGKATTALAKVNVRFSR